MKVKNLKKMLKKRGTAGAGRIEKKKGARAIHYFFFSSFSNLSPMFVKSAIVALLTVAGASASDTRFLRSLDPEAAEVECPLKDGEEKGRVLDCKKGAFSD